VDTKKKTLIATERDAAARAAWCERMADVAVARLVFVDETGTTTRMTPLYAVAPRGARAYGFAPRNYTHTTTLVGALTLEGMIAPMVTQGGMTTALFVAWLGAMLLPLLMPGQIVVLDNLNVHTGEAVQAAIEAAGCQVVYLPAYSPDYNPIEGAFSKIKQWLRRAANRTQAALEAEIGAAVGAVTAQDAVGWFTHCGYPPLSGQ
jgi:transposase